MTMNLKLLFNLLTILVSAAHSVEALSTCCQELHDTFPSQTFYSHNSHYNDTLRTYFSGQEADLRPNCFVVPENTDQVSSIVGIMHRRFQLKLGNCNFAIRGGGNAPIAGAANVARGVTIDMSKIDNVSVNENHTVVSVGGGARWEQVYTTLELYHLTAAGGRASEVSVGGLVTGGGMSFFQNRDGFVCDNVLEFEVVFPNGTVANINTINNHDLTIALRGGSNNFGIVTRLDLPTISLNEAWGGELTYSFETASEQLKAFTEFHDSDEFDELASMYTLFVLSKNDSHVRNSLFYAKADRPETPRELFKPFLSIEPQRISVPLEATTLSMLSRNTQILPRVKKRQAFLTTTWRNDFNTSQEAVNLWKVSQEEFVGTPGLIYYLHLQPVLPQTMYNSIKKGGNSLGLDPNNGPLVVALLSVGWEKEEDDGKIYKAMNRLLNDIENLSKSAGTWTPWKYLNYADKSQEVIDGYGEDNVDRLKRVSQEVDPEGFFQEAVSRGFYLKIDRQDHK